MYQSNKKKRLWKEEKERLLNMTRDERRKEYREYVSLDKIPSLMEELKSKASSDDESPEEIQVKNSLCEKVSFYKGDITQLEVDAIVNAANTSLLGGGGVDGCIHRASGPSLLAECRELGGCETGQAKITCGYELPAKYVIHTVGPIARGHITPNHKQDLASCYNSSLTLATENDIRTIAFPCISTGIYGYPNEPAANVALTTVKEFLKKNRDKIDRVIFCVFLEVDFKIYKRKLNEFFPKDGGDDEEGEKGDSDEMKEDTEGKPQSPPMKKIKEKKEDTPAPDSPDEEYSAEEATGNTQDMTAMSLETNEGNDVSSPATDPLKEGEELSEAKITGEKISVEPKTPEPEDAKMTVEEKSQEQEDSENMETSQPKVSGETEDLDGDSEEPSDVQKEIASPSNETCQESDPKDTNDDANEA
ncbi:ADP-ribose glycohydrolase MACROD2 [Xenopus laevis]|uniref:ADP-ribose glycohydrolase MACROD2 n=1 Tax=Xenopus laevis TaxID=8355 RepID=MACD2_XENLA|nr:ADP-ribose glycohydrolase MACROD2 [Xenopus laevis]Q6PAV8.1 RecName: Full=ADP-ribose glycohydrolase MACROD2; AltName: Full=MACRO domain-containing protein 2; AltName: Full=O-acetyl-ADP-ribose deacetylase MACROD2; AltName: Full=[Protein ADP-ribosylaspartate] hydrolase MACROD2; AltName: Full=[Protein ADP-ribosylglutamate] hydrolase MACROD2 [Xenopus laevis]AAH60026.1 Macrod2 protein [Xenopus laevis]